MLRDFECWLGDDDESKGVTDQSEHKSAISKSTAGRAKEKLSESAKPKIAMIYFTLYCFITAISYVFVDLLYKRVEGLSPWHMFFIRSGMGILIMAIHYNR